MATKRTPASKVVSERWFVRIDGEKSFLRRKCEELGLWQNTVSLHALFHTGGKGENPHVHYIHTYAKPIQKQAYVLKVKELFGVVGSSYACSPWDGNFDGAGSYLYHEEEDIDNPTEVFATKGFEAIHIEAMKEAAHKWRSIILEKKAKASMRLEERAFEHFGQNVSIGLDGEQEQVTLRDIWIYMWHLIRNGECYNPGDHHIRKYALAVFAKYGSDDGWNQFVDESFDRAFPKPFRK